MDKRTRELIAIGVSVGTHCQQCLAFHLDKARQLGASEEDIQLAIKVGHMVEQGASTAMRTYEGSLFGQTQSQGGSCCSRSDSPCCG